MRSYSVVVLCFVASCAFLNAQSQTGLVPETGGKSADQGAALDLQNDTWKLIEAEFTANRRGDVLDKEKDVLERKASRSKRSADVARQAEEFYTKNPNHPMARAAKKLEVLSLFDAVEQGEVQYEPKAERISAAFRGDHENSESDRFEVTVATLLPQRAKKSPGGRATAADQEAIADSLIADFPNVPNAHRFYIGALRLGDEKTIRRVAAKVAASPAPSEVKAEAKRYLDRLDLVGRKIEIEFTSTDGKQFRSTELKTGVLVYVWTAQSVSVEQLFGAVEKGAPAGYQLIGVNIDQDVAESQKVRAAMKPPGIQYEDARGLKGPVAAQLVVLDVPSVYLVDNNGILVAFGSPYELSSLSSASK